MKINDSINFVLFYDKIKEQSMSLATAYKLSKIYKKAKEDESFYQTKLVEILRKYAEVDEQGNFIPTEDGKGIKINVEDQAQCIKEIDELVNIESNIQIDPLDLDDLKDLTVTPNEISSIMNFIK